MVWTGACSTAQETVDVAYHYGFIPKRVTELSTRQAAAGVHPQSRSTGPGNSGAAPIEVQLPAEPGAVYSTLFTTMFLHGGWLHLISNMWMLWIFGNNVEDRLGHFMYLCFYLVGRTRRFARHWAIDPSSDDARHRRQRSRGRGARRIRRDLSLGQGADADLRWPILFIVDIPALSGWASGSCCKTSSGHPQL